MADTISVEDFLKVDIRVGTILSAKRNPKAIKPAYVLDIDFGDLGQRKSSAQITENYSEGDLVGRQILAVINFPAKIVAGITSEVLVLAAVSEVTAATLIRPDVNVLNGQRVL